MKFSVTQMDPLVEVPNNDLPKLRDLYKENNSWPYGVEGYSLLSTLLSNPTLIKIFNFKFYCIEGDISHGMVAVTISPNKEYYYEVHICPTSRTGLTAIEKALTNTNVIDWTMEVSLPSVSSDVMDCLKRLCEKINLKFTFKNEVREYFLDKDARPYENLDLPENTYVAPLKEEHLDLLNHKWAFSGSHTYEYFKALMLNGLSYVLYSTEDHAPVSWIVVDYGGSLSHLYCVDAHRQKGYAEYITKFAANDLLGQGKCVLVHTLKDNLKPQNLFYKLGFIFLQSAWWVTLTRVK